MQFAISYVKKCIKVIENMNYEQISDRRSIIGQILLIIDNINMAMSAFGHKSENPEINEFDTDGRLRVRRHFNLRPGIFTFILFFFDRIRSNKVHT